MKPGILLNCLDRKKNPVFESHDPSMMKDPVSGWYYSYATDATIVSRYQQGIPIRKSKNLVDFEYVGIALSETSILEARDNGEYPNTEGFWAPFVEYVDGEYRMYYSATKAFGSSESKIWLAVAGKPEGPFENRGVVADTWFTGDDLPNAIDPHIIDDLQGRKYLVYGSFFGGIYIKELDKNTGMSKSGNTKELGKCIAHKPQNSELDGPEGAAIIYQEEFGYYYLFLSYGWLGETYDIRVGRSKEVLGPYRDYHGMDLNGEACGLKLANSYCFYSENPYAMKEEDWEFAGFCAPGHGVPFYDQEKEQYFFVHHIRDGAKKWKIETEKNSNPVSYRMHYMMVRRMEFVDEWPVLSPMPYAGEGKVYSDGCRSGELFEWIYLDDGNEMKKSFYKEVASEAEHGIVMPCYDFENSRVSECIVGITSEGTSYWGKKVK